MYIENNKIALQQLFAGENIYLLKNEFEMVDERITPPLSVSPQTTPSYYQPKQKIIILLNSLNPADSELLGKILGAVKLDLRSVDIVELDKNQDVNLSQIFTQKSVNQLVTFGINLSKVNLDIKLSPYQIFENQGVKFIYSDSLTDIQNDVPKKKALWGSLKEVFM
jgi:DNA polymerase III psi subunit